MHDDKQPLLPFTTAHQYSDDENDSEDSVNSNPHTSISLQRITRDEMKHPAQHSSINSTDIKNSDNGFSAIRLLQHGAKLNCQSVPIYRK